MLQKLKTVLENSKNYQFEECVIDSLMRLDSDCSSCIECPYSLCHIRNMGIICGVELNDDYCGVV